MINFHRGPKKTNRQAISKCQHNQLFTSPSATGGKWNGFCRISRSSPDLEDARAMTRE